MNLAPYLFLHGTCEEAFNSYADLLGGTVEAMMTYKGTPAEEHVPADWRDKVMHACLKIGDQVIMGSDSSPGMQKEPGGYSVSLHLEDPAEAERIFAGLSEGGTVTMPMEETFWAKRFGAVTDRFGTPWMVNCAPDA